MKFAAPLSPRETAEEDYPHRFTVFSQRVIGEEI